MNSIRSKMDKHHLQAIVLLAITAMLWSLGGLLIKLVTWNPVAIAGMRSGIAALVMLTILKKPKFTWSYAQIGAAISYAFTVILFVTANKMTTSTNAIMLQYTAPVYVALLSAWMLKEKIRISDWVTIFLVIGGMVLFFVDKLSPGHFWGNIIAILSGISFGMLAIFTRMQKNESPLESLFLGNMLTALIGLPFMFQSAPDTKSWIGLGLLGVFQLGLSYILYAKAMKHATALEGVIVPILEPILNPIWVFIGIGETPSKWALIGGLIVLISVTARCVWTTVKVSSTLQEKPSHHKMIIEQ